MVANTNNFEAEAVFFLDNGHVIKEVLYVEFEAILDNYVGIPEFSGLSQQAAYVSISADLTIQTVVLFCIDFDKQGQVPACWNLPLRYMASLAHPGPDLGEGCVKVLSAADPVDEGYRQHLWEPGRSTVEVLTAIRRAVKRNKLGIYAGSSIASFSANLQSSQIMHATHFAGQPMGVSPHYLDSNLESALREQQQRVREELEAGHAESLKKVTDANAQLQQQSDALAEKMNQLEADNHRQIELIVDKYKAKLRSRLAEQEAHWQEKIAEKELALHYAEDKIVHLQDEINSLEEALPDEKRQATHNFLREMMNGGVELIVSESGIGSFGLKLAQVEEFLEDKDCFWAAQLGLSLVHYKAWHKHYQRPVCQVGASTGCECGEAVGRVNHPRDFVIGESDVCRKHRLKRVGELL